VAISVKVESVDRDVHLAIDQLLSPAAQSRQFAESARQLLEQADSENKLVLGRVPRSQTWVDGQQGAALESVKSSGTIVREYELVDDVLLFIGQQLWEVSPVLTGFYRAHHSIYADGTEIDLGGTIPDAREYVFINDVIYARKIEGAWRPAESKQAPQGVYEFVALKAEARFGNIARIKFGWRAPAAGILQKGVKGNRSEGRFPAIIVTMGN
jgi:hypothetical protein